MMGQAIEERRCHLGVAKYTGPIAKGQIGGDDDRGALVEPADQMKEQLTAGLSEGQIAEFVENDKVHAREIFGEPPLPAGAGFALQPIDEIDDGIEAAPGAAADAGPRDSYRQMRLAGAGRGRDIVPDTRGRTRRFTTLFIRIAGGELQLCGVIRSAASRCW